MRVLIAEDDPISRRLLEVTLARWGHEMVVTHDGTEAWQALQREDAPRLAILDWMMPGVDGIEVCRRTRVHETGVYTYFILLTGKGQKADIVKGLEAGADDYLTKPFDAQELQLRLRAGSRILDLQERLIGAREALRHEASHDSLTHLRNRAAILDTLTQEVARARREGTPLSIVLADVDHFKQVNDTYGHLAGDRVLSAVAETLREMMRSYDDAGRYGGEEFLITLPGCEGSAALKVADRLRERVSAMPVSLPGGPIAVTMSLGVASLDAGMTADAARLIRAADTALYQAKNSGRNRVVLAAGAVNEEDM